MTVSNLLDLIRNLKVAAGQPDATVLPIVVHFKELLGNSSSEDEAKSAIFAINALGG